MFTTTKAQRRKIKRALREKDFTYVVKAALFHIQVSKFFTLKRLGYQMKVFYTPFSFWLWTEGRERSDENFYKRFLREGDTVIDAGANIGLCTLLTGTLVGKDGHVYSFEPHPRTFKQLCVNVKKNKLSNVTLFNRGVGDKDECVSFTDEYVSDINHVDRTGKQKVLITSIDSAIPNLAEVTLFKLDVEGYEFFAIVGATKTLENTRVLYFEHNPKSFARYGYSFKTIYDTLSDIGFCIYQEKEGKLEKLSRDYISYAGYENLLALRSRDASFVEKRLQDTK